VKNLLARERSAPCEAKQLRLDVRARLDRFGNVVGELDEVSLAERSIVHVAAIVAM
jgi:hypothetical protein